MARDTGRRGRDGSDPEPSPVDQLETWRTRRHDDTAEFPAVQWDGVDGPGDRGEAGAEELRSPRRRRPGAGLLAGAALLLVALVLSGMAAVGVGPVAQLLGSGDGDSHPSGTTGSIPSSTPSSAPTSTTGGSASGPTGSSPGSSTGSSPGSSSDGGAGVAGPGAAAPSRAPAPDGSAPTGDAPGTKQGRPDRGAGPGGRHGTPPQPPAGGPGV